MIPDPLHPAVVHFPIVFMMLLPIVGLGAWWAIRRGIPARRAWVYPVALSAALSLSAFVAVRTGEAQAERVGDVVGETLVSPHEETAEVFLVLSLVLLGVTAAGLLGGAVGRSARVVALLGTVALTAVGYRVGASGGDLVYRDGAAGVYAVRADSARTGADRPGPVRRESRREGDDR